MSALVLRHNPAADMLSNWFDRFFSESPSDVGREQTFRLQPKMDISEEDEKYVVTVDIPGLTKEDVGIKVESGMVKIEGERKAEQQGKYRHAERAFGKFMRVFSLPDDVEAEGITAKVANGVLELQLPKSKKAQPREIKIS